MKYKFILILLLPVFLKSQDSTKTISHEIGVNAVGMVKQLISNNPNSTLSQSPYLVIYNLYFKDKIGFRAGLGIEMSNIKSDIEAEPEPRTTNNIGLDTRLGLSINFINYERLTVNANFDLLQSHHSNKTVSTFTSNGSNNTINTTKTITEDLNKAFGGGIGFGVKFRIYKQLFTYVESNINFMAENSVSKFERNSFGTFVSASDVKTEDKSSSNNIFIRLPTTLYLILKF